MKSTKLTWMIILSCFGLVMNSAVYSADAVRYSPERGVPAEEVQEDEVLPADSEVKTKGVVRPAADEEIPAADRQNDEEEVRVLPALVELETEARRAAEAEACAADSEINNEGEADKEVEEKSLVSKNAAVIHPDSYHYPFSHAVNGQDITLNDYSMWYVHPWDRLKILNWASTDLIFIKPNTSWFSSYKYVLHNESTGEDADVNYIPTASCTTYWILDIDLYNGHIILSDGTHWPLNSSDYSVYKYWRVGDRVVVGLNTYWRSGSYPYILINVEFKNAPYCDSM